MKIDSANTTLQTGTVKPMNNSEAKNDIQVSDPNQARNWLIIEFGQISAEA